MKQATNEKRWCINCQKYQMHTVWIRRCSTEGTRCNHCNHEE